MRTWASVRVVQISGVAALVTARAGEGFPVAVLPGTAGVDAACRDTQPAEPGPHRCRRERGAVVRAPGAGRAVPPEARRAARQDVVGPSAARDSDAAARPRVLVHEGVHPQGPTVVRPFADAVVGPDGGVRPRGAAPGLAGHPEALRAPAPRHPLVVHAPALGPQQGRDATGAGAPEPPRPRDAPGDPGRCIRGHPGRAPQRAARLGDPPTGPTRRDGHDGSPVHERLPPGAPGAEVSRGHGLHDGVVRAWSATRRLRRAFARSRALRRFA